MNSYDISTKYMVNYKILKIQAIITYYLHIAGMIIGRFLRSKTLAILLGLFMASVTIWKAPQ